MVDFRVMRISDFGFFMSLMDMVGWGMTSKDFERLLEYSYNGCFIAEVNGEEHGMVATTNYGKIGWIGNLVVKPESRGRKIGELLMLKAINHLKSTGVKSIKLDSVQPAIPLYRRLGFKEEYWSLRFLAIAKQQPEATSLQMKKEDLEEVYRLDLSVFKADRSNFIEYIYENYPGLCFTSWMDDEIIGYIMGKDGKDQVKIGPWVAKQGYISEAEQLLFSVMNKRIDETLWVGVPDGNKDSIKILETNGFNRLPSSLRMCYGECRVVENVESVFGLGGPDKG